MPLEVPRPEIVPRMKQSRELVRERIDASDVGPFASITMQTGKSWIGALCRLTVLSRNDMVDWKRCRI